MIPLEHVLLLSALLFGIGTVTALLRRNLIAVLMAFQLMFAAACLAFVGFNRQWAAVAEAGSILDGQIFVLIAIATAAAQAAVGLAIAIAFVRHRGSVNVEGSRSEQ